MSITDEPANTVDYSDKARVSLHKSRTSVGDANVARSQVYATHAVAEALLAIADKLETFGSIFGDRLEEIRDGLNFEAITVGEVTHFGNAPLDQDTRPQMYPLDEDML